MIRLFTGPGPLAQLVREELHERGIGTEIRNEDPLGQIYGSAMSPSGLQSVVVSEDVAEKRRADIEEVLAMVSPTEPDAETSEESEDR
jgi:hypothetical protein